MKWLILAFPVAVWFLLPHPANAQQHCGPHEDVIQGLMAGYSETRQSVALGGVFMFETYANLESGSWTVLRTNADMVSCIIASGQSYENVEPEPLGTDG